MEISQQLTTRDVQTGRTLIKEGTIIDGGIYRRSNHPGIVVDFETITNIPAINEQITQHVVNISNSNWLNASVTIARKYMPINAAMDSKLPKFNRVDRFNLSECLKNESSNVGTATPDAQALCVLATIERRVNKFKRGKVQVVPDKTDGHAQVVYISFKNEETFVFDPTRGDKEFKNTTVNVNGIKIGKIGEVIRV